MPDSDTTVIEEESREEGRPSKFEAALESLEALGLEKGRRWEAVPQPRVRETPGGKEKRASGDFMNRKKTTCMLYLQVCSTY